MLANAKEMISAVWEAAERDGYRRPKGNERDEARSADNKRRVLVGYGAGGIRIRADVANPHPDGWRWIHVCSTDVATMDGVQAAWDWTVAQLNEWETTP